MLDLIHKHTQYIVFNRKKGTMYGLKGNSVNAEAVPATVSADKCYTSTVKIHGKGNRRKMHEPGDLPFFE